MASRINIIVVVMVMMMPVLAFAEPKVGQVALVKGTASIRHVSGDSIPATFGADVNQMDTLETQNGTLKVLFDDKTLLTLGANSKVLITEHVYNAKKAERSTIYDIVRGTVRAIVDQPTALKKNDVRLQTPTAIAGIRGTDAGVRVAGKSARMVCFNGLFEAYAKSNPSGRVMVKTGEWTDISGPIPTVPRPVTAATMRQFSDVMNGTTLQDVLNQKGGDALSAPPTAPSAPPFAPQAPTPPPQPQTPPMLPGGNTNTPQDAGESSSTGPTTAPLTFPH